MVKKWANRVFFVVLVGILGLVMKIGSDNYHTFLSRIEVISLKESFK